MLAYLTAQHVCLRSRNDIFLRWDALNDDDLIPDCDRLAWSHRMSKMTIAYEADLLLYPTIDVASQCCSQMLVFVDGVLDGNCDMDSTIALQLALRRPFVITAFI